MNEITYNNKNLSDFGVYYDSHSSFGSPERDVELVEIAGKNGALIIDNDRYRNIDLAFPCYVHTNFLAQYRSVMAYLQSCKGYNRLEITQEPNHFRMASFNIGSQPTPNQLHRSGQFPVVFNCKPQRFLKSGETPVTMSSSSTSSTGNPVTVSENSAVNSLSVALNPIQTGTGEPSPTNIRPITGHTSATVTRTADGSSTDYTIDLNGTRYGGTVDLVTGVLTVDRVSVDMGGLTWTYESATNCMITPALSGLKLPTSDNVAVDAITSVAKIIPASQRTAVSGVRAYVFTGNRQMLFRNTGYTDPSAFKTAMNGNNIVYALETPQTVQLTPQQISLLTGTNYISSDGNVTVTVTAPTTLVNPTLFESKPLIRVYGSGLLAVNNQYITVATNPFPYIDIDCDMMDAFYGANNANQYVSLPNDYITLKSGNNYIAYDGTVDITPRWFEI